MSSDIRAALERLITEGEYVAEFGDVSYLPAALTAARATLAAEVDSSDLTGIALQMLGTIERMELIIPEITSTIRKAVEQGRPTAPPAPAVVPVAREVGELVDCLQIRAASLGTEGANLSLRGDAAYFTRGGALLQLQRLGPAPAAVPEPVAERLPGEGDLDGQGTCWVWNATSYTWGLFRLDATCHSHWLPANAIPLPPEPEEAQP